MAMSGSIDRVFHYIRVKLYPSNLPGAKGAYSARVKNEALLNIEDVCASLKTRGGFTGNYDDIVSYVKQYFDEAVYLLCDGYAVNTGYFSIHPAVGGFFDKASDGCNDAKNRIGFRFRVRAPLRKLIKHITLRIEEGNVQGMAEQFTDVETGAINKSLTSGGFFSLSGYKIKITGDNPECGVYFVSVSDPLLRIKAVSFFPVNTSRKVAGRIPVLSAGEYIVEIKTQYTVGGINLKEPRTITGSFKLAALTGG